MLSTFKITLLLCCFCCIYIEGYQFQTIHGSQYETQILDCVPARAPEVGQPNLPCNVVQASSEKAQNPSQGYPDDALASPLGAANVISINFNNIVRRQASSESSDNCTSQQKASENVICSPNNISIVNRDAEKTIRVHISSDKQNLADNRSVSEPNIYQLDVGSSNVIKCRLNVTKSPDLNNLNLKLRWLRLVTSSLGLRNQSIVSDDNQLTISASRVSTLQRDGGLDLLLNDFQIGDSGDYFCQAITTDSKILDEQRVHIVAPPGSPKDSDLAEIDASSLYSSDNLEKLLPSLQIIPEFSEMAYGSSIQLACVTRDLDPDPDPERIEWQFEPFERPGYGPANSGHQDEGVSSFGLPSNVSQLGNILIIWQMTHETVGIYKCAVHLTDFNLTSEASAELALRPDADAAPQVYVNPELLRMSANGSAKVQCEITGYPSPSIEWYRIEAPNATQPLTDEGSIQDDSTKTSPLEQLNGLRIITIDSKDAMAYCLQNGCRALDNLDPIVRQQKMRDNYGVFKTPVTGLSWIQINQARAYHQGQYVCKATNKHGSSHASSLVDVEFKEMPEVEIDDEHKHQTIVLDSANDSSTEPPPLRNVTFRCSIKSGQPKPRLKWLRASDSGDISTKLGELYGGANILSDHDQTSSLIQNNLDIYDLTRVSTATSKVSTRSEDNGRALVLQLSTISVDDEGVYICLGENEIGRHSAVAHLVVRKPPQVRILQTSPKIFRPNESFQLDCFISGHPAPIDIEWSRSDRGAYFSLISRHSSSPSAAQQERAVLKFDRTTLDEAGEYTCAARDPLNLSSILRDTIMLLAEDYPQGSQSGFDSASRSIPNSRFVPKLLVRPTKITAEVGSNITLDCLAISGLQPTVVEWLAPASAMLSHLASSNNPIRPYYRSPLVEFTQGSPDVLLQFGSKLRLFNVSKAHEGVYQCKGRNKAGIENAPALVNIIDRTASSVQDGSRIDDSDPTGARRDNSTEAKTKIARMGTNIELRCQVNGMEEQPATSWSREGRELPSSSVQIDHNLWIQNITKSDEGLYLCSARSKEPNEILQAKIKLLVQEEGRGRFGGDRINQANLNAKIVASKNRLELGDSVTLECILSLIKDPSSPQSTISTLRSPPTILDNLERQVIWTNLHSGQSLFQDNVYIQNNLLIIYDLKPENMATYRCNYNDLTQHTDYRLQIEGLDYIGNTVTPNMSHGDKDSFVGTTTSLRNLNPFHDSAPPVKHIKTSMGAKLTLECPEKSNSTTEQYFWTRGRGSLHRPKDSAPTRWRLGRESEPLVLNPVDTSFAGLYQCNRQLAGTPNCTRYRIEMHFLVEVQVVSAKFVQRPVSFVTLPAVSDADHQLEIELKFFPENDHGLMLFSGAILGSNLPNVNGNSSGASQQTGKPLTTLTNADYIVLGMVRGHLEFRFELGDGVTLLRSRSPLKLNQWHRVLIERNRRGATMWLDGQAPQNNSSTGKFFNLNLDSLLYVGGHQIFLTLPKGTGYHTLQNNGTNNGVEATRYHMRTFYGFSKGYQGCISSLRVNGRELNLMARNRSVSLGIFECDKLECPNLRSADHYHLECSGQNGICQVDRTTLISGQGTSVSVKRQMSHPNADLRCVCAPGFSGPMCNATLPPYDIEDIALLAGQEPHNKITLPSSTVAPVVKVQNACDQHPSSKCNVTGTGQCQPLSSTTFRCHCRLGFMGELCDQVVAFSSEISMGFNQPAYIQLVFNAPEEVTRSLASNTSSTSSQFTIGTFNETEYARLTTFTENQTIAFKVHTRSSFGLLFYIGQTLNFPSNEDGNYKLDMNSNNLQTSKSVVANLLARLSPTKVGDFMAIALVDGHIELSYELGSGLAILRSSKRVNDGDWHKIEVSRTGKTSTLTIDELQKHEAHSPGKLSMLNVAPDIYMGGLPTRLQATISSSSSSGPLLSTFMGCLSSLQINSLGPINLMRDDHITRVRSARNLVPCDENLLLSAETNGVSPPGIGNSIDQGASKSTTQPTAITFRKTTRKPTKPSHSVESDDDDSDELSRRSS